MRRFVLVAVLAAPLCLALSGCGVLIDIIGSFDQDPDEENDPVVLDGRAWDPPPSAIVGQKSFDY